jgi:hypothetical protein
VVVSRASQKERKSGILSGSGSKLMPISLLSLRREAAFWVVRVNLWIGRRE